MYTSGNESDPPVPFGLAIGDIICGAQAVQGVLAGLIHVYKTGVGVKLELSLMESLLDFQFELLTTYYESGKLPRRSKTNNGHSLLGAPYGIHQTKDGYIAIAMVPLADLAEAIACEQLLSFGKKDIFSKRDSIKKILAKHLAKQTSQYWIKLLKAKDLWAMELLDWEKLRFQSGYQQMELEQKISLDSDLLTTRCPIRFDNQKLYGEKAAPDLGADTDKIIAEFGL
jgi:crotonobetainyl-CoA:carnitine CoA-transferase CaiB-like acyl-CoA transferase